MPQKTGQQIDVEPLLPWEYQRLLPQLPYHWQLVARVMWETGIRISEVLNLSKKDMETTGIWVRRLKKKKPQRDLIPLSSGLLGDLQIYSHQVHGQHLFPYTAAGAWYAVKQAAKMAGLRQTLHPHLFRHGFATEFARMDLGLAPLEQAAMLKEMLGHTNISTTERYFRPGKAEVRDGWKRLHAKRNPSAPKS